MWFLHEAVFPLLVQCSPSLMKSFEYTVWLGVHPAGEQTPSWMTSSLNSTLVSVLAPPRQPNGVQTTSESTACEPSTKRFGEMSTSVLPWLNCVM